MTPQLKIGRNVPPSKISPGNRTPPCVFYRTLQVPARGFCAQPGRGGYLKPQASSEYDLSNLAGPGVGGGSGRAHARRPPLSLRDISPAPQGNLPQPYACPIFSYGRKDGKRPFKGAAAPLKIPRWGALWPRPQTPRPGSLVVGVSITRERKRALNAEKLST